MVLEQDFIYVVKNADTADKTAAKATIATGAIGADTYDILVYTAAHTFTGTSEEISINTQELEISLLSPAFVDWVTGLNTPATHMETHDLIRPFADNDMYMSDMLFDDLWIHLSYVIGATDANRHAWYSGGLLPLVTSLDVGDLLAASDFLGGFTGTSLASTFGVGTAAQWQQLLDHVNMMVGPHLKKFPR